ncbi:MAG: glycerate 2-kinase [Solirubrobacteraceae bacterium]|nr:glycerate 2-kinase [Solirubrobacteraceae bacterium]
MAAAAIGRGLERAGLRPPDLCPVAGGGRGTLEVLLPALGGETASARVLDALGQEIVAGFGLVDDGGTAIVEAAQIGGAPCDEDAALGASSFGTGQLVAAAIDAGAAVVVLACGGAVACDGGAGAVAAIERGGGLRGAALVALCDERTPWEGAVAHCAHGAGPAGAQRLAQRLRERAQLLSRDPRGVPMTGAGGGLAGGLWAQLGAQLVPGPGFVLQQLGFDARMREARAVAVGEARLDAGTFGRVAGEIAIRARQSGVPCHAFVALDALDRFDARILDVQAILEAATVAELEDAGERLARFL